MSEYDTLGPGETLGELLAANGVSASAYLLAHAGRAGLQESEVASGRTGGPVYGGPGEEPDRVVLQLSQDSLLDLVVRGLGLDWSRATKCRFSWIP